MKNIKRFEIDVPTVFGEEMFDRDYPLKIIDLNEDYANAVEGSAVAQIRVNGSDDAQATFEIGLPEIESFFDVLTHIKAKVLAQKKPEQKEDATSL